jgi:GT2 family glycosyltransferase
VADDGALRQRRVAVLMACHNRRQLTLACLRSLYQQRDLPASLAVFLVDDGSRDGTSEAVAQEFPQVEVIAGTGQLYWGGGMRLAFEVASRQEFDFHLWLNDDVILDTDAVNTLLATYSEVTGSRAAPTIIVGAVRDPISKTTSYSGLRYSSNWHPLRFEKVKPGPVPKRCLTLSGNVVLIPGGVLGMLGGVDSAFVHSFGDEDYGLRLTSSGGQVWVTAQHVGICPRNVVKDPTNSLLAMCRNIRSVKRLPPGEYLLYTRRHGGALWPLLWSGPYVRSLATPLGDALRSLAATPRRYMTGRR